MELQRATEKCVQDVVSIFKGIQSEKALLAHKNLHNLFKHYEEAFYLIENRIPITKCPITQNKTIFIVQEQQKSYKVYKLNAYVCTCDKFSSKNFEYCPHILAVMIANELEICVSQPNLTDCIAIYNNDIIISTYDFIDDNTKTGLLLLFDSNLQQLDECKFDGILHFKLIDNIITLCTWKGDVYIVEMIDRKFNIKNKKSFENITLLYLDCNNHQLLLAGDKGEVIMQNDDQIIYSAKPHEYSVWCTLIDSYDQNLFYTGSDDSCLNYYDIRQGLIKQDKKSHTQGITYILDDEQTLTTTSFDGYIRIFDKRQNNIPIEEYKRSDGIWRIIKQNNLYLNALFQEHKYELISIENKQVNVIKEFKEHESLAYAMDWKQNFIVTSSFYDKIIRTYKI